MPPNILLITSDQHRADYLGCTGHPSIATPHLDQLARRGVILDQAMVDCPVCIPARTTLLTGIQSHHYGSPSFNPPFRIVRDRSQLLGGLMRTAGYQTELVGKTHWHLPPTHRGGFDHVTSFADLQRDRDRRCGTGWRHGIGSNELAPMLSSLPPELNSSHFVVDRCVDFLDRRELEQPFLLWASFFEPHPPTVVHEPFFSMYRDVPMPDPVMPDWAAGDDAPWALRKLRSGNSHDWLPARQQERARQVYAGMITNLDYQLGRLFGALSAHGLWENTVVIYTSDHGEFLGDCGTYFKGSVLAPAARIPGIVAGPPELVTRGSGRRGQIVGLEDWLPTFCELAGVEAPDDIDGESVLPLLRDEHSPGRAEWHAQIDHQHAFHTVTHKYCYFADDGRELVFDRANDPWDRHDLSSDRALTAGLRERFIAHLQTENHAHLESGRLLNLGRTNADIDPANVMGWMALPGR